MPEEILTELAAYGRRLAAKQARKERQVINANASIALRLFAVEKEACGLPPTRELLARLVRSVGLRAKAARGIVSI